MRQSDPAVLPPRAGPLTRARPRQKRSLARMEAVLDAADAYVAAHGAETFSILEIADVADVPRASIYQYYPDKYALLSHVAERHLKRLTELLAGIGGAMPERRLPDILRAMIEATADYFDLNAAAGSLLLGGPFSRASYRARETQIAQLGAALRLLARTLSPPILLPEQPDVALMAAEIALACMRHGYYQSGCVTPDVRMHAAMATEAYLARFLESQG